MTLTRAAAAAAALLNWAAVLVIVVGVVIASGRAVARRVGGEPDEVYPRFRSQVGRAILLGLELMVAGSVVRTVTLTRSLMSVLALGLVVAIRTFLSFAIEMEITGRPPWRKKSD